MLSQIVHLALFACHGGGQFSFGQKKEIIGKFGVNRKYFIFHCCCYSQSQIDFKVRALLLLKNFWMYLGSAPAVFHIFQAFLHLSCGKMGNVLLTGHTLRLCISIIRMFFFC